jgi:hypothetical protein
MEELGHALAMATERERERITIWDFGWVRDLGKMPTCKWKK